MHKFFRKREKHKDETRWHTGHVPQEQRKERKIREFEDRWTQLPERAHVWLNGCSGWVSYKWNKNTWKPW